MLDAGVGVACLQSSPVDVDGDVEAISGRKLMLQCQSDLACPKDRPPTLTPPPVETPYPGVDVRADVERGRYTNDYDVQMGLDVVASAYDFYFDWVRVEPAARLDLRLAGRPPLAGRLRLPHEEACSRPVPP
ncbi:hypothetical protein LTR53_005883 [Teratosphaeriaceae sp. CCFEE 6253]|nr:hypothetical protein LTR53_005883 [Teratosphaeriaceae sp. CCFEE 6253]